MALTDDVILPEAAALTFLLDLPLFDITSRTSKYKPNHITRNARCDKTECYTRQITKRMRNLRTN